MAKKAVVIGGGIGGLCGAVRLARMGWDVHLYEKNSVAGGKMGRISEAGFYFDTGPTLITMPFVLEELFSFCGCSMDDYLSLVPVDPVCRYFYADTEPFDAVTDTAAMEESIGRRFPADRGRYARFMKYSRAIYDASLDTFITFPIHELRRMMRLRNLRLLPSLFRIDALRTVHRSVCRFFKDPHLVQLFDRYPTYNGSDPFQAPATLNVIPHVELGLGGFYIQGGLYTLVRALKDLAGMLGVSIHTNTEVTEIFHQGGRVTGIRAGIDTVAADSVLCNADVVYSHQALLPGLGSEAKRLSRLEPSLSGIVFCWGVRGHFQSLAQHNILFSRDYRKEFNQIFRQLTIPDDPTIYISVSSKADREHAPEGHENWFVLLNMPYVSPGHVWDGQTVSQIKTGILEKLRTFGLDVEKDIVFERVITPKDFDVLFHSNRGSIYGISSNTAGSAFTRPPNRSRKIKGLYFAGGSTHPGGGVPMCMLSAKIAADLMQEYE